MALELQHHHPSQREHEKRGQEGHEDRIFAAVGQDVPHQLLLALSRNNRAIRASLLILASLNSAVNRKKPRLGIDPNRSSQRAVSGFDRMVDPRLPRDTALRIRAHTVTFDEASHAGGYTHYATRLTNLIERAATSVGI